MPGLQENCAMKSVSLLSGVLSRNSLHNLPPGEVVEDIRAPASRKTYRRFSFWFPARVIFSARARALRSSVSFNRIAAADFFPGANRSLLAIWRPGEFVMDVQHRQFVVGNRAILKSSRFDSRGCDLDDS